MVNLISKIVTYAKNYWMNPGLQKKLQWLMSCILQSNLRATRSQFLVWRRLQRLGTYQACRMHGDLDVVHAWNNLFTVFCTEMNRVLGYCNPCQDRKHTIISRRFIQMNRGTSDVWLMLLIVPNVARIITLIQSSSRLFARSDLFTPVF